MDKKLVMLAILDGWGINESEDGNAVTLAKTPNLDSIMKQNPSTVIHTSGLNVGLPDGQMGTSEVGHMNIGAGRIVYQDLAKITKSIQDGDFFENEAFLKAIENCKKNNSAMHLMGLTSDGGVHTHINHLYALLELCKKNELEKVYVHCFTDGRDTAPTSGEGFIQEIEDKIAEIGIGKIASISGRYYAMDRDTNWDRVKLAYDALTKGEGFTAKTSIAAIENSYQMEQFDEFIKPTVIIENDAPVGLIKNNDSVIFFNFRRDRAREITRAFVDDEFAGFEREKLNLTYVCMTDYDDTIPNVEVAYKTAAIENTFGEYISNLGYKQLRIAETEKYAHVTFFFNGGNEVKYENEDRILVASPKVATYDLKPEMSAYEITDTLLENINNYDVIILNFANGDMVGHTGSLEAAIKAVETLDNCIERIYNKITELNGTLIITADHGNCEEMIDENNNILTSHTTNKVPFLINKDYKLKDGKLADIAPTILYLLNEEIPLEMTGDILIERD